MEFGIFNLMGSRDSEKPTAEVFAEVTEQTRLADELGYAIAWFAEHHFSNYCLCASPLMLVAHCASITKKIRLGTAVVVLPLYNPARLAAEIATADALSNGRLMLGVGAGDAESNLGLIRIAHHLVMEGDALVGNLLTVEPLSDEVEPTAGRFLAPRVPRLPPLGELLINLGAPPATPALRFATIAGLEGLADLRTPASGRVEVLKVSRDAHADEEGVATFEQAVAEGDPRRRGHLVGTLIGISGGNTLASSVT